jgi:hypothetical protein
MVVRIFNCGRKRECVQEDFCENAMAVSRYILYSVIVKCCLGLGTWDRSLLENDCVVSKYS